MTDFVVAVVVVAAVASHTCALNVCFKIATRTMKHPTKSCLKQTKKS